jgi:hypothetical protein
MKVAVGEDFNGNLMIIVCAYKNETIVEPGGVFERPFA